MNTHIIMIKEIVNRERQYLAYFRDDFLKAVYSVSFSDSITGAISLNKFVTMITTIYKGRNVHLQLSSEAIRFKNPAVIDALLDKTQEVKS